MTCRIGSDRVEMCNSTNILSATFSCSLPPKPGFGVSLWEGLSGGSRAGLTLERCSQLTAFFAIQPVSWAAVWLVKYGVPGSAPFPSSNLVRFGRWCGTQEAGRTVAESLVALYRVGTHQIRRGRRVARSSTSQGSAEPLCARIKGGFYCLCFLFFLSIATMSFAG